jgi:hypothetical protein
MGDVRGLIWAVLLLLSGSVTGASAAAARSDATPVPVETLTVGGDRIVAVVPALPDATALFVLGKEHLYRSDDGGETYTRVSTAGPPSALVCTRPPDAATPSAIPTMACIAAGVDKPKVLLAGDHPICGAQAEAPEATPLVRSTDGGETWNPVDNAKGVRPIAIYASGRVALATTCRGVAVSRDGGLTWGEEVALPDGLSDVSAATATAAKHTDVPAALVIGTSEGGTSRVWALDLSDPAHPRFDDHELVSFWGHGAPAGWGERLVVGAPVGVWVSSDPDRWHRDGLEDVVTVSEDPGREGVSQAEQKRGYGINAVAIDPANPDHLWAGTVRGLYESRDAGTRWQRVDGVGGDAVIAALVVAPGGARLLAQTGAGVVVVPLRA